MAEPFYFICYSGVVMAKTSRSTLADHLVSGPPSTPVWLDHRNLQRGSIGTNRSSGLCVVRRRSLRDDQGQCQSELRVQERMDEGTQI